VTQADFVEDRLNVAPSNGSNSWNSQLEAIIHVEDIVQECSEAEEKGAPRHPPSGANAHSRKYRRCPPAP
jgi:hypothetical protein